METTNSKIAVEDIISFQVFNTLWNAYFVVYGFKILLEISKVPF